MLEVNELAVELIALEQHLGRARFGVAEHGEQAVDSIHLLSEFGDSLGLFFFLFRFPILAFTLVSI